MNRESIDLFRAERICSALSRKNGVITHVAVKEYAALSSELRIAQATQGSLEEFASLHRERLNAARAELLHAPGGSGLRFNSAAVGEAQYLQHLIAKSLRYHQIEIRQIEADLVQAQQRLNQCELLKRIIEARYSYAKRLRREQQEEHCS